MHEPVELALGGPEAAELAERIAVRVEALDPDPLATLVDIGDVGLPGRLVDPDRHRQRELAPDRSRKSPS